MARLLALLLGCALAGVILGIGLWLRNRPETTQEIELRVVDARGRPVERFGWELVDSTPGSVLYTGTREQAHAGGIAIAHVPVHRIRLEIKAPGLHRTLVGPLGPKAIPPRLDVVVADLGVVTGTVTLEGQPVVGAQVMLAEREPDIADGVPAGVLSGCKDLLATTDASGAFRIGSDFPNIEYYARGSKPGHAPGTAGPVHVGDPPLELQLHDGGSIEGHLRMTGSSDPDGIEIELYRADPSDWELDADGHFVTRSTDGGRFRFEHVDPGAWLVRLKPPERKGSGSLQVPPDYVPFIVKVAEHQESKLDMDLSEPFARLEGHAKLNGKPWNHSWVHLHAIGEQALMLDWTSADKDGRWTMRARAPGTFRLVVWGNHEHALEPDQVSDLVELSRDGIRWEHEFTWTRSDPPVIALDQKR